MRDDIAGQGIGARFFKEEAVAAVKSYFTPVILIWQWARRGGMPLVISVAGCMAAASALVVISNDQGTRFVAGNGNSEINTAMKLKLASHATLSTALVNTPNSASVVHALNGLQASQKTPINVKIISNVAGAKNEFSEIDAENTKILFYVLHIFQPSDDTEKDRRNIAVLSGDGGASLKIQEVQLAPVSVDQPSDIEAPVNYSKLQLSSKLRSILKQAAITQGANFRVVTSPEIYAVGTDLKDLDLTGNSNLVDQHDHTDDASFEIKTIMISSAASAYQVNVGRRGSVEGYRR